MSRGWYENATRKLLPWNLSYTGLKIQSAAGGRQAHASIQHVFTTKSGLACDDGQRGDKPYIDAVMSIFASFVVARHETTIK